MTYYDDISASYNELHGEEQQAKNNLIRQALAELGIRPNKVLDIGCGTGIGSEGIGKERTGIDPSNGLRKQCTFPTVRGVAESLPFPDKSFDLVMCVTALHNTESPEKVLKEMARVTREFAVITVLKKSQRAHELAKKISHGFTSISTVDEAKDKIFIVKVKQAI